MANIDLLQHELDRFGIVTVADAVMYEVGTNTPVLKLDTLKISNLTSESQNKQIKGGQYADLLGYYAYGRAVSVDFQDALISDKTMTELWGAAISANDFTINRSERKEVIDGAATLDFIPNGVDAIVVLNVTKSTELVVTTGYTIVDNVITIVAGADDGDLLEVYYTASSADVTGYTPVEMVLKSTSFPRTVKFVGTSFVLEQKTGQRLAIEIEIPKLKLDGAFTLTLEAEGDASVFDFKGMALINEKRELVKIKTLGILD